MLGHNQFQLNTLLERARGALREFFVITVTLFYLGQSKLVDAKTCKLFPDVIQLFRSNDGSIFFMLKQSILYSI
jgi:hypothetical protein